jgi:hypothetical protein
MPDDLNGLLVRLVAACEDTYGRTPLRIIVEPGGEVEVSARVGFRGETHPEVLYARALRKLANGAPSLVMPVARFDRSFCGTLGSSDRTKHLIPRG